MVGGRVDGTGENGGRVNRYHPNKAPAFIKSAVFGLSLKPDDSLMPDPLCLPKNILALIRLFWFLLYSV